MDDVFVELKRNPLNFYRMDRLTPRPHLHKEVELVYVISGCADCYADRQCSSVSAGDMFIAFPNQIHYYLNSVQGDYLVLVVSTEVLWGMNRILNDFKPVQNTLSDLDNSPIPDLFEQIYNQSGEYQETMQVGLLNQLIYHIISELDLRPQIKSDNSTIHAILHFCTQNYANDLTLEDVAQALHLNKYHISHLLNKKLGIGFSAYINTLRVDKACRQLSKTDKTIADISEESGFGSIRSFNRAFSQIMHITPQEYRRQFERKETIL